MTIHIEIYQLVMMLLTILASVGTFTTYFYKRDERLGDKIDAGLSKAHFRMDDMVKDIGHKQDEDKCMNHHSSINNVLEKHETRAEAITTALSKGNERLAKIETCLEFILREMKKNNAGIS